MEALNHNLIKVRKRNHLTQEEFAAYIGVKRSNIGAYEEGRATPNLIFIQQVIEIFKIPKENVYDFLFNDEY
jgi:DNA-binding XRE family transcriptional regulator